ncbi:MAG: cation transporter, partial [Verrucomicrobiae bacterium]|nr:cation transporter [Verrucomicrobiae bacterium]
MREELQNAASTPPTRLKIGGMNCQGCVANVTQAVLKVPSVARAEVSLEPGSAVVYWKPGADPNPAEVAQSILSAGHPAEIIPAGPAGELRFQVAGMTCGNCAAKVRVAAVGVRGVASAEPDVETGTVWVRWESGEEPNPDAVVAALKSAGYPARAAVPLADGSSRSTPSWRQGWGFNVRFGGITLLTLLLCEWGFGLGMERGYRWLAFGLGLAVQVFCGGRFYRGAWQQLRVGKSNMDTLVSLGSTAAFGYSAWGLFAGFTGHLYFMEAVGIITLISIGHWMEGRVSARAADALRALMHLAPDTARWLSAAGVETEVPVAKLGVGDRVLLKPGDRVPVDGEVEEGASAVNEAMLTG